MRVNARFRFGGPSKPLRTRITEFLDNPRVLASKARGTAFASRAAMRETVWRQIRRMLGELFREAGLLVGVLAPLEFIVTHGSLTLHQFIAIVVVTTLCLSLGVVLGLER